MNWGSVLSNFAMAKLIKELRKLCKKCLKVFLIYFMKQRPVEDLLLNQD